jgi:hypothetical protein
MKQERLQAAVAATHEFLVTEARAKPENDGWFGLIDICWGVRRAASVRTPDVMIALTHMLASEPPQIEDTWMRSTEFGEPVLVEHFEHPNQPENARHFYRVIARHDTGEQ